MICHDSGLRRCLELGDVSFPGWQFCNRGRSIHSGQQGGMNMLRDLPRDVTLIETGRFDAKSMIAASYPLDRVMKAVQAVAGRTQVGAVVVFDESCRRNHLSGRREDPEDHDALLEDASCLRDFVMYSH